MRGSGAYLLVCHNDHSQSIRFGAAGVREIPTGYITYVGSASGTGGFSRIERHRQIAAGTRDTRHWHIDYLLGDERISLKAVYRFPGSACECAFAQAIPGQLIADIGASDCNCTAHLFSISSMKSIDSFVDGLAYVESRIDRVH